MLAGRRVALRSVAFRSVALLASLCAAAARAQGQKIAQKLVLYQEQPKDGAKCSACLNFEPPNTCAVVDGFINPEGWCVAFVPKTV